MKKIILKSNEEWVRYLTIERYLTVQEIENRKKIIIKSGCDYDDILQKIKNIRLQNRIEIFKFGKKSFYLVETHKLKNNIEKMKQFWDSIENIVKDNFTFELLKETLAYEGFYSSTIEGAHSTVKRAQTLAKGIEDPKNKDEKMVFNNFKALIEIKDISHELDNDLIKKIHKLATEDTLDKEKDQGEYRDEPVEIVDAGQNSIFVPITNIKNMKKMLNDLLIFLKVDEFGKPLDTIYKAIAFHFLFAYIHPFIDGNGRTVRILFTYLLKYYGYDMFYYISLSEIIYKKKAREYYDAFINVERSDGNNQDENDLTYFFYYMSDVMIEGLDLLKTRINTYFREEVMTNIVKDKKIDLSPRQKRIIKILSNKESSFMMTTEDISKKIGFAQRTIQDDLKILRDFDLVTRVKAPNQRKYYFRFNIKL